MNELIHIDLFAGGCGGFSAGLKDAGFDFTHTYFSEIEKNAIANYKFNNPHAEKTTFIGDVKYVSGTDLRAKHPTARFFVTFGWPCQDNSIAGKRKGQGGHTRSALLYQAGRIIKEIWADYFMAENVRGLYSVNDGADFRSTLDFLSYLDTEHFQYHVEQQLFNTLWLLPQNRERTYFIGRIAKAGRSFKKIFPVTEDDFISHEQDGTDRGQQQTQNSSTALRAGGSLKATDTLVETAVDANYGKGMDNHGQRTMIIQTNTKAGFEEAQEGDSIDLKSKGSKTRRGVVGKGKTHSLDGACNQAVIQLNPSKESGDQQPYAQNRVYDANGVSPALSLEAGRMNVAIGASRGRNPENPSDQSRYGKGGDNIPYVNNIRRLTEIECERLQGYHDDWTKFGIYPLKVWINKKLRTFEIKERVKEIPSGQRYKIIGNAVTKSVVTFIGKKLKTAIDNDEQMRKE